MQIDPCDDAIIIQATQLVTEANATAAEALNKLVSSYPNDPRLTFLQASMMVAVGRLVAAHDAFTRTLALSPDFALARYQYGLFLLTSGEVARALEIWAPLDQLSDGNYLRSAIEGMRCLVSDDFHGVRSHFAAAISKNVENEPLNNDLRLLLQQIDEAIRPTDQADPKSVQPMVNPVEEVQSHVEGQAVSEASLLLQRFGRKLH